MAFALVGAVGAVSTGTSGAALTPAFDTGASRAANNLLICWVSGWTTGTAAIPATPSGWSPAVSRTATGSSGQSSSALFYKLAAGGDAAPTIAAATGMTWAARVAEFSGNATSSPLDKVGSVAAGASPGVPTASGPDVTSGELACYLGTEFITTAATATMASTPTNFAANDVTNNAVSSAAHWLMGYGITTANAVADKDSITFASATSDLSGVIASFAVGGAQAFPRAITDALALSQSLTATSSHPRAPTDTLALSQSLSTGSSGPAIVLAHGALIAAASGGPASFSAALTDTLTLSQGLARTGSHPRALAGTVVLSESLARASHVRFALAGTLTLRNTFPSTAPPSIAYPTAAALAAKQTSATVTTLSGRLITSATLATKRTSAAIASKQTGASLAAKQTSGALAARQMTALLAVKQTSAAIAE